MQSKLLKNPTFLVIPSSRAGKMTSPPLLFLFLSCKGESDREKATFMSSLNRINLEDYHYTKSGG